MKHRSPRRVSGPARSGRCGGGSVRAGGGRRRMRVVVLVVPHRHCYSM